MLSSLNISREINKSDKLMTIAFFVIKLIARLYLRVCILLTSGKHLHDRIIGFFVLGLSILPLSTNCSLNFGIVPTVWYFLFSCHCSLQIQTIPITRQAIYSEAVNIHKVKSKRYIDALSLYNFFLSIRWLSASRPSQMSLKES